MHGLASRGCSHITNTSRINSLLRGQLLNFSLVWLLQNSPMMWKLSFNEKPISWSRWSWGELHVRDSVSEKTRQLGWLCNRRDVNSIRHESASARIIEWRSSGVHIFLDFAQKWTQKIIHKSTFWWM